MNLGGIWTREIAKWWKDDIDDNNNNTIEDL